MSKPTQEQIDAVFAELDIAFPLRNEITIAKALVEARVTLAAAAKRAEAAEAECEALRTAVDAVRATRTASRSVRTVDDAMVGRFLRAYAECESERPQTFTHRMGVRAALDAALAVQP